MQESLKQIIAHAKDELIKCNVEDPQLDVEILLAHVLGINRSKLYLLDRSFMIAEDFYQKFLSLLERRKKHEPIAYILGSKEFFGHEFFVDPRVLIPRPDTESIVEAALRVLPLNSHAQVVDVCTGSGCIAISLALARERIQVTAIDISVDALEVAKRNVEKHGLQDRVTLLQGDLLEPVLPTPSLSCQSRLASSSDDNLWMPACSGMTDLIVTNPPYIKHAALSELSLDVKDFEPHLALFGENVDGLGHHQKILNDASKILKSGGYVIMEIGFDQGKDAKKLSRIGFSEAEIIVDYGQNNRGVLFQKI